MKTNSLLRPSTVFKLAAVGTLVAWGFSARPAQAGYVVTLAQVDANVVATGNGAIDLTGLKFLESMNIPISVIVPFEGAIQIGAPPEGVADFYTGATGPKNFGTGFDTHT